MDGLGGGGGGTHGRVTHVFDHTKKEEKGAFGPARGNGIFHLYFSRVWSIKGCLECSKMSARPRV